VGHVRAHGDVGAGGDAVAAHLVVGQRPPQQQIDRQLQAAVEAAGRRQRQPAGVHHRRQPGVRERQDLGHGRGDPLHVPAPVGLEQPGAQVGQADPHHLRLDVQWPPQLRGPLPAVQHLGGGLGEQRAEAIQVMTAEGRLRHAARAHPAGPLGADQAVTHDRPQPVPA
jgi:hypothetical protein